MIGSASFNRKLSKFNYLANVARSWHCNSNPYRTQSAEIPAPVVIPVIPEYKGEYRSRMQEWSYIRKPGDHWKAPNVTVKAINEAHRQYQSGELNAEGYSDKLLHFLLPDQSEKIVSDFLASIGDSLTDGSFCPSTAKFAQVLKKAFFTFRDDNANVQDYEVEEPDAEDDDDDEEDTEEAPRDLSAIKHRDNRKKITLAYKQYSELPEEVADDSVEEAKLFELVTKFAKGKIDNRFWDAEEVDKTSDDYAQQVAIYVWEHLSDFNGGSKSFYPWLHRICFTKGWDALNETNEYTDARVPLLVEMEGDDGGVDLMENPLIRPQERRPMFRKVLPPFIQGVDLQICNYIREGYGYKRIAKVMSLTVAAVTIRIAKMRAKIAAMKAEEGKSSASP
jgi:DNA-directed RNA polymerase specialized sigma24 family protein